MTEWINVQFEGCTWKFTPADGAKYEAAIEAAEAEVIERFGSRPHFRSPDAVAAWEHEVVTTAHSRLFGSAPLSTYKGAPLPVDSTESWATVEAFRRGVHSLANGCPRCGREVEYGSCRWTDCPGNAGVEDTNYL